MRTQVWVPSTRLKNQEWWFIPITPVLGKRSSRVSGRPLLKKQCREPQRTPDMDIWPLPPSTYTHVHTPECMQMYTHHTQGNASALELHLTSVYMQVLKLDQ